LNFELENIVEGHRSGKGQGSVKMGKGERGKEEGAMVVQGNESEWPEIGRKKGG